MCLHSVSTAHSNVRTLISHQGRKKGVDEAGVVGGGVAASAASSAARRANAEVHANFYRSQLRASRQSGKCVDWYPDCGLEHTAYRVAEC